MRALERLAGVIAEGWKAARRWPTLRDIYNAFELQPSTLNSHDAQHRFIAVRLALRDIAVDLCTIAKGLNPNALIDVSDIASASISPFWLDELWLDSFTERRLPLHTSEAAQVIVERVGHNLDTKIMEFNERATDAIKLAMFASDYDLISLAKKELRRAVGCLLGYGSHKDMFALEVLESLDLLARNGDTDAQKSLLDLAGAFGALTEYTDGDATDYVSKKYYEVIAAYFPERVPGCYAHLIHDEEWHYAEALAIAFAETDQVESRTGRALLESYIVPPELLALKKTAASRSHTKAALASVQQKTGRATEAPSEQKGTTHAGNPNSIGDDSESGETEVSVPDPSKFPPKRLQEYLSATRDVSSYGHKRKLVTEWLKYWEGAGCAEEALTNLEAAISETRRLLDFDDVLDVAFEISLKTQGRSKAFSWLIRAHVRGFGWYRWPMSSDEEAQARMRLAALHYRQQWRKFIRNTAKPVFLTGAEQNGIVIGLSRLVYLLVEVGELDLARTYALEMAQIFKEELAEQPIEMPEWSR